MSFGFSASDVTSLIQLTVRTYRGWKRACGEYSRITGELDTLEIILSRVAFEVQQPTSLLEHHDQSLSKLQKIVSACKDDVKELENIVSKFRSLGISRRSNWDRLRLGNTDLSSLQQRLGLHITAFGTYLSILGISSVGRVEDNVKILPEMKRTIDNLAAEIRAGRREGSVMTTYEDDEKEVWRQFRRELILDGFQSGKIDMVKRHLRRYLKRLNEAGLLDEEVPEELESYQFMSKEAQGGGEDSYNNIPPFISPFQPLVESGHSENEPELLNAGNENAPTDPGRDAGPHCAAIETRLHHLAINDKKQLNSEPCVSRYLDKKQKSEEYREGCSTFGPKSNPNGSADDAEQSISMLLVRSDTPKGPSQSREQRSRINSNKGKGESALLEDWNISDTMCKKTFAIEGGQESSKCDDLSGIVSPSFLTDSSIPGNSNYLSSVVGIVLISSIGVEKGKERTERKADTSTLMIPAPVLANPSVNIEECDYYNSKEMPIRMIAYQPLPLSSFYPVVPIDVFLWKIGWDRLLDPEDRWVYIDLCADRGAKRCFWKPPIPEKEPYLSPPVGWQRVETVSGRIWWTHSSTGLVSYTYPTKNQLFLFKNGEPMHFLPEGHSKPRLISQLAEHELAKIRDGVSCQISRKLCERSEHYPHSRYGGWRMHLITSNTVILQGRERHRTDFKFRLCQSIVSRRRITHYQDIHDTKCNPHRDTIALCTNVDLKDWKPYAEMMLYHCYAHREKLNILLASHIAKLTQEAGYECTWEPLESLQRDTRLFNLIEKFNRHLSLRQCCMEFVSEDLKTELASAMVSFCKPWTETTLRYGPLGDLYQRFSCLHDRLRLQSPVTLASLKELESVIIALPGSWSGMDLCAQHLLRVQKCLSTAASWLVVAHDVWRKRHLKKISDIYAELLADFVGHVEKGAWTAEALLLVHLLARDKDDFVTIAGEA